MSARRGSDASAALAAPLAPRGVARPCVDAQTPGAKRRGLAAPVAQTTEVGATTRNGGAVAPASAVSTRVRDQRERLQRSCRGPCRRRGSAEPVPPEEGQPVESVELVGAQRRREARRRRGRLDAARRSRSPATLSRHGRGLADLVGEVLEVGPEARLVAADAQAGLPLVQRLGLLDELAQRLERRLLEREVAAVDERAASSRPCASAWKSGAERDLRAVDRDTTRRGRTSRAESVSTVVMVNSGAAVSSR